MTCGCQYRTVKTAKGYRLETICSCAVHAAADPPRYPPAITKMLAEHGLKPPPPGLRYSVQDIDETLKGKPVDTRMQIKSVLRQIGALQ